MLFILIAWVALDGATREQSKPAALLAAESARSSEHIYSARIEYSRKWLHRAEEEPHTYYYTWRCAGSDYATTCHGDDEHVVMRGPDGEPAHYTYDGPQDSLFLNGQVWQKSQDDPEVRVWEAARRSNFNLMDLRWLGLTLEADYPTADAECAGEGVTPMRYSSHDDNGIAVVRGEMDGGALEWRIDPAKSWSVVELASYVGGKRIGRQVIDVAQVDGVWMPRAVRSYVILPEGEKLTRELTVLYAELNRPEHPTQLKPESIGVEVGTQVMCVNLGGTLDCKNGYWDGKGVISRADFDARVAAGELQRGPTVAREKARGHAMGARMKALGIAPEPRVTHPNAPGTIRGATSRPAPPPGSPLAIIESEWEKYTREFIVRFRLNADQTEHALSTLRDCQDRARQYLSAKRERFEEFERRLAAAATLDEPARATERARLDERAKELRAPIDEIFERQLKPGLDKLPTAAQRKAAETAASQPATPERSARP